MYARGHFLFLRTVHGGQAEELLRSRDYFERALAIDPAFAPALAGLSNFYALAARRSVLTPFRDIDHKAALGQALSQIAGRLLFILNHQDLHAILAVASPIYYPEMLFVHVQGRVSRFPR